jgi:hypothetical protein
MASRAYTGGGQPLPLALIAQAVPRLTRHELAALTERLIEALDAMDLDADLEEDDPAGQCDEDGINTAHGGFWMHGNSYDGPGCWIGDGGL